MGLQFAIVLIATNAYFTGAGALKSLKDRHRRQPLSCAPATPPGMRVRTRRFEELRSCESGYSNAIKVSHSQHTVQVGATAMPPPSACGSHLCGHLVSGAKCSKITINRGATLPLFELNCPESSANP